LSAKDGLRPAGEAGRDVAVRRGLRTVLERRETAPPRRWATRFAAVALLTALAATGMAGGANAHDAQVQRALAWARGHGWHGRVTSGFRSRAAQARLYALYTAGKGNRAAPPGNSSHELGQAVDVTDTEAFAAAMASAPKNARLLRLVPGEPWHFSVTGH
jgi:hypothetical protein